MTQPCSVLGCPCECFNGKGEKDSEKCKDCKHKKGLHVSRTSHSGEVPFPEYWNNHDGKFNSLVPMQSAVNKEFQELVDKTYNWKFTQDRRKHNPTQPAVPKGFEVRAVYRNENSA